MKFKVWDDKKKCFLDLGWPFFLSQKGELWFYHKPTGEITKADPWFLIDFSTDEYDGNGNELFDGDITTDGQIVYSDTYLGWFLRGKETDFDDNMKPLYDIPLPEKIGNIRENPELLEQL